MSVSPVAQASTASSLGASSQSASASGATSGVGSLDYNAFLKLLVAQMKSQDPTNPTDSTQWVSQLASFSNVEQSVQMNAKLNQILQQQSLEDAEAMIGHTVTSADGQTSGKVVSVTLTDSDPIATLDNGGKLILTPGVQIS